MKTIKKIAVANTLFAMSLSAIQANADALSGFATLPSLGTDLTGETITFETAPAGFFSSLSLGGSNGNAVVFSAEGSGVTWSINSDYAGQYNTSGFSLSNSDNSRGYTSIGDSVKFTFNVPTSGFAFHVGALNNTWTLRVYDQSSVLLGSSIVSQSNGASNSGDYFGYRAANIKFVTFTDNLDFAQDWILIDNFTYSVGPSAADTQSSMTPNAYALRGAFIQQSAIINNGLSYDCATFDAKGICLSAGGRVTDANNPSTNSQGALLIASYRANDNWRIGGYLDQNLSSNDPRGVNLDNNNPMAGVFAVWNQSTDGTGYQVRVAAGYSDKDVTISRTAIGTAEAGKGDSSLRTQAYSATISRGIQLNDSRWIASPYVGVRYTKIKRAGYTEDSDVTAPLTYSGLSQETTTALAGVRFNGQLAERVNVMISAGVESDIAHNTGDYAATGVNDLTPIAFNQNVRHVRPVAQVGVSYAIDKRQVVSANLLYRQEAFNSSNSTAGMVTYQVGF